MMSPRNVRSPYAVFALFAATLAAHAARVSEPTFNKPHGFYESGFSVVISTGTSGATIRYTTDASEPTASHGTVYAGAVSLNRTTCLRAAAFKSGMTASLIHTRTYIFLGDVITQTRPAGYPTLWGANKADYDMDPDIVNDSRYSGTIKGDLKSIPTLSLVTATNNLWGDTGIYHTGGGKPPAGQVGQNRIEVPVSVELIYADGRAGFQIDCGLKSHSHVAAKRSMRLLFKSNYGDTPKLEYPFFEDAVHHAATQEGSYGKIFLRAGMNKTWTTIYGGANTVYTRDQWVRDAFLDMTGLGGRGLFVHLYLNGVYWGLYNPVERTDSRYAADYLGGAKNDWFSCNQEIEPERSYMVVYGSRSRYDYLHSTLSRRDLSSAANYNEVKNYLDVEHFCDYIALHWYAGVGDWPGNNFYIVGRTAPAGPLLHMPWDAEDCFLKTEQSAGKYRSNDGAWIQPSFYNSAMSTHYTRDMPELWRALDNNKDFLMTFADRVYTHCYNGGALTEANCKSRWADLAAYVERAVVGESARWGDYLKDYGGGTTVFTRHAHWYAARDFVTQRMTGNVGRFIQVLRNNNPPLYPSLDPPTYSQYGGTVAAGFKLTVSRPGSTGTIYYRTDGEDPRVTGGAVAAGSSASTSAVVLTLNSTATVKARMKNSATWSALAQAKFTVTGSTPTVPTAPSSLAAAAQSTSQIKVSWSDNSANETGFKLERSLNGST
ncbi:MAG: CotH kinase family protein, partial [Kiritimatiellae bacterium]|nr:CotH kinase family protein [Kiritimatiellia bacterium]